jgi:hypothetical protein
MNLIPIFLRETTPKKNNIKSFHKFSARIFPPIHPALIQSTPDSFGRGTRSVAAWQIVAFSAGGAAESSPRRQPWVWLDKNHKPRQGRQIKPFVCFLPPLPGLVSFCSLNPRFHRGLLSSVAPRLQKHLTNFPYAIFSKGLSGFNSINSGFFRLQGSLTLSGGSLAWGLVLP